MKTTMSFLSAIKQVPLDSFLNLDEKIINRLQIECLHKTPIKQAIKEVIQWVNMHKNAEVKFSINKLKSFFNQVEIVITDDLDILMELLIKEVDLND
jgi:hypothetical protein